MKRLDKPTHIYLRGWTRLQLLTRGQKRYEYTVFSDARILKYTLTSTVNLDTAIYLIDMPGNRDVKYLLTEVKLGYVLIHIKEARQRVVRTVPCRDGR
jgi:hypothetical protein